MSILFLSEIDTRINSINSFFARPFILFLKDLSQNLYREIFTMWLQSLATAAMDVLQKNATLYSFVFACLSRHASLRDLSGTDPDSLANFELPFVGSRDYSNVMIEHRSIEQHAFLKRLW